MDEIISQIESLIEGCDDFTIAALGNESASDKISILCSSLTALLPSITAMYSTQQYSDHFADIPEWIALTQKLIAAVNGHDVLLLLDIVSFEIKENLIELRSVLGGRNEC